MIVRDIFEKPQQSKRSELSCLHLSAELYSAVFWFSFSWLY